MSCLPEIREVLVYDIVKDLNRHPREEIYKETIQEYAEALSKGFMLPEIEVFFDGKTYHLSKGYYRVEAHIHAGIDFITAIVHPGSSTEALIHALGANANHGLRRTNDDKKKAVEIALKDPAIQKWSDRKIAYTIRVSQPFVSKIRKELTDSGYQFSTTRVCANGKTMETENIGQNGAVDPGPVIDPESPNAEGGIVVIDPPVDNGQTNGELGTTNITPAAIVVGGDELGQGTGDDGPDGTDPAALQSENDESEEDAGDDQENSDTEGTEPIAPGDEDDDLNELVPDAPADGDSESGDGANDDATDTTDIGVENDESGDGTDPNALGDESGDLGDTDHNGLDNEGDESEEGTGDNNGENSDLEDTQQTDLGNGNDESEEGTGDDGSDPNTPADEDGDLDDTDPDDPGDEDDKSEVGTGDDGQVNSDLDDIGHDALKLMVIDLQDITKKQEAEIEAQNSYITDLEQQVEGLKKENQYLQKELQASIKGESAVTAYLDTNPMSNQHVGPQV